MPDVIMLYASISGRTRKIASQLVMEFSPLDAEAIDLRDGLDGIENCKLVVFGSPTYGVGEWHHLWETLSPQFTECELEWSYQPIAILALGDAKHHPDSFAGAILHLRDFVSRLNARLVGEIEIDESYDQELCSPLLTSGRFPGLVLDQVKQRRMGTERIKRWVAQLKQELEISVRCDSQHDD